MSREEAQNDLQYPQPGKWRDMEEVVRRKDCKYHDERYRRISVKWLPCMEIRTEGNWFCASAERREE